MNYDNQLLESLLSNKLSEEIEIPTVRPDKTPVIKGWPYVNFSVYKYEPASKSGYVADKNNRFLIDLSDPSNIAALYNFEQSYLKSYGNNNPPPSQNNEEEDPTPQMSMKMIVDTYNLLHLPLVTKKVPTTLPGGETIERVKYFINNAEVGDATNDSQAYNSVKNYANILYYSVRNINRQLPVLAKTMATMGIAMPTNIKGLAANGVIENINNAVSKEYISSWLEDIKSTGQTPQLDSSSLKYTAAKTLPDGREISSIVLNFNTGTYGSTKNPNPGISGAEIKSRFGNNGNTAPENNSTYSQFTAYLYYLDAQRGQSFTAAENVYATGDNKVKMPKGAPKNISIENGLAVAKSVVKESTNGQTDYIIKKFAPLTDITDVVIQYQLPSGETEPRNLPEISKYLDLYKMIMSDINFVQYWFKEVSGEKDKDTQDNTTIKNDSGFSKEEMDQVRTSLDNAVKSIKNINIDGLDFKLNGNPSIASFGLARESLAKSAIIRYKEAEVPAEDTEQENPEKSPKNKKEEAPQKRSTSNTVAAEIVITLSDEDVNKIKGVEPEDE